MAEVPDGTIVDGRYRILGRIGSGGMADVYSAEDTHLGREVALKMLHRRFAQDAEFVERFRREASSAASLQHAHVVNVFDRGEHDGTYYIAMEHLRGHTLKQLISAQAPFAEERAIDIAVQVLQAAGFAHRRGVIHRDFKPHNVIVDEEGRAKVTDFGIARAGASEITETGSIMGTAQYLSPEQAQGQAVTEASDLYSIGVVLYEMLAGRLPFEGDSAVAIALRHVSDPPPPLGTHPLLEQVVMCALAKAPAERFASADAFIAALESARAAIVAGDPGENTAVFPPFPPYAAVPGPPAERRRWTSWALAGLLTALALAVLWAVTRPEQVRVPDVTGQQLVQARATLEQASFDVGVVRVRDVAPVDQVIDQDPNSGQDAARGSEVELEVSDGPGDRVIPSVEGLSRERAVRELNRSGFKFTIDPQPSDDVDRGNVIRTSPAGGTRAEIGSRIRVLVSSGPKEVEVPAVVGSLRGTAESRIEAAGLLVEFEERESPAPEGQVVAQDPPAFTDVRDGSRVTLVISEGPQTASVPDVRGLSIRDARIELRAAGFRVDVTEEAVEDPDDDGVVVRQRPERGKQLRKGRTVVITVGRYEEVAEPEVPIE